MKKPKLLLPLLMTLVMMAMCPQRMWAISGDGTSKTPYLITKASDWTGTTFQDALKNSTSSSKVYATLTADFTLTSVTLRDKDVYIVLDGQGHNITLSNVTTSEENTGLFGKIGGGEVKNLRIGGNLTSSQKYMGNLCGKVTGDLTISNVICSASLAYNNDKVGDATAGGIIGQINGNVTFNQCGFTYRLYAKSKGKNMCGMVGFRSSGTVVFNNCFCKAEWLNAVSSENYAYMRGDGSNTTYNNCYYVSYGTGDKATDKSSGGPTEIDASKFGTGELAYILNGSSNGVARWYQNLSGTKDGYPWPYVTSYDYNTTTKVTTTNTHAKVYYGYDHGATSQTYNNSSNTKSSKHVYYTTCTPTWSNTDTPASCKATLNYKCSACNATASEAKITPAHSTTVAAACLTTGTESYTATSTQYKKDASNYHAATTTGTLAALGHDYASTFTTDVAATCITAGSKSKHCSRCSSTTEVTPVAALGHDYDKTNDPNETVCIRSGCNHSFLYYTAESKVTPKTPENLPGYSASNNTFSKGKGKIEFTSKLTSIGNFAFSETAITGVIIPVSVTSIGQAAFFQTGLTSVTIPASVNSIGPAAFNSCDNLKDVTVMSPTRLGWKSYMFKTSSDATLRVPSTLVAEYKAEDGWNGFGLIRCISHTTNHVDATASTCATAGNIAHYHCDYCGDYSDQAGTNSVNATIATLGHGQTNGYTPTYTWSDDINTHTCSFTLKCKDCNTEVVSNQELTASKKAHTDATCTAAGSITYQVTGSYSAKGSKAYSEDKTKTYTIDATGHNLTSQPPVDATCLKTGNHAYWKCSLCNKVFSDAEGKNETTMVAQTIPASGKHCFEDGVCTICHLDMSKVLCFTAEEDNATVTLNKYRTPAAISLIYSTDGGATWSEYIIGSTIQLAHKGDKLYLCASDVNEKINNFWDYYYFVIDKRVAASGDATTLLNAHGTLEVPAYAFHSLFYGCSSLTTAPNLPATTLADYCYERMFYGCSSLTTAPDLPATTLAEDCYYYMFYGCSSLSSVTVNFTDWNTEHYSAYIWLNCVASSGTFVCPEGLDVTATDEQGNRYVPEGWTVKRLTKGDVNVDGEKSIADIPALIEILSGRATDAFGTADVNGDGSITTKDVKKLQNMILDLHNTTVVEEDFADYVHDEVMDVDDNISFTAVASGFCLILKYLKGINISVTMGQVALSFSAKNDTKITKIEYTFSNSINFVNEGSTPGFTVDGNTATFTNTDGVDTVTMNLGEGTFNLTGVKITYIDAP